MQHLKLSQQQQQIICSSMNKGGKETSHRREDGNAETSDSVTGLTSSDSSSTRTNTLKLSLFQG